MKWLALTAVLATVSGCGDGECGPKPEWCSYSADQCGGDPSPCCDRSVCECSANTDWEWEECPTIYECFDDTDAGPDPPTTCDPLSQVGCGVREKCAIVHDSLADPGHFECVPDGVSIIGTGCSEAGEADNCRAGGTCVFGVCREHCDASAAEVTCDAGECAEAGLLDFCFTTCDPLAPTCDGGNACYFAYYAVTCLPEGTVRLGEPCNALDDCEAGTQCWPSPTLPDQTCRRICGPWSGCVDASFNPIACGCDDVIACDADEMCMPLPDFVGNIAHDTAGVCVKASEVGCDCATTPPCPP